MEIFSQDKLWIAGIASTAFVILLALFKRKSEQLDTAEKIVQHQKEELHVVHTESEVSDIIRAEHKLEALDIERKYDIQRKAIQDLDDKPLSESLLRMLNDRHNKDKDS